MKINQNDMERIKDMVQQGKMTVDQANVENVRVRRVLVVNGSMPSSVRKALNAAVKSGLLSHKKKDGGKPEVYFHPNFEYLAIKERNDVQRKMFESIAGVCGN